MRTSVQVRHAPFEQKAPHKFRMSAKNDAYAGLLCVLPRYLDKLPAGERRFSPDAPEKR